MTGVKGKTKHSGETGEEPFRERASSSCHLVILSSCHPVILSSCHLVILSSCHLVTLSSRYFLRHFFASLLLHFATALFRLLSILFGISFFENPGAVQPLPRRSLIEAV